jgi:pimeloyl-ACP methyl ester carboxylesterase
MSEKRASCRITSVDGREVYGRILSPSGEDTHRCHLTRPLLLLHGLGCSHEAWIPTLRCLAAEALDQPVVAPDMPGYGRSPGPPGALDIEELADWTVRLLDVLAIPSAHVAGSSMGCQVAMELARRHPARVESMLLVGPTTGHRFLSVGRYLIGLLHDGMQEPLRYNRTLLRMYRQMGLLRYLATAKKMLENDPLERPEAIRAPCLVVRGARDKIVPEPVARRLAAALPRGAFIEVEGAAHAVQFSAPERFTRITLSFLTGIEAFAGEIAPCRSNG